MKLALGTVQFGLAYGIAGKGTVVAEAEVARILRQARAWGIDCLDTAPGYGDIEQRLAALAADQGFSFVSKILPLPAGVDGAGAADHVRRSVRGSLDRLGPGLRGLMFHQQEDLAGAHAQAAWEAAQEAIAGRAIALGVSCYSPGFLEGVLAHFPVALSQLPGNALDQRAAQLRAPGVEVHLRSAFLQGLLLQEEALVAQRLPAAGADIARWLAWCARQGLAPLQAALSVVKGFAARAGSPLTHCVVGVESVTQLEEICRAWEAAQPLSAPELATQAPGVIDPRAWNKSPAPQPAPTT